MATEAYFVTVDGKQTGPFKGQQIRNKLHQGKLRESDFIWREGMDDWVPISSVLDELPGIEPPPPPEPDILRTVEITHPNELPPTVLEIPEKGVYEPPATLKQKNLIMKLGWKDPEHIRSLGRDQASFIIDAVKQDTEAAIAYEIGKREDERRHQQDRTYAQATIAIIVIGVIAAIFYYIFIVRG